MTPRQAMFALGDAVTRGRVTGTKLSRAAFETMTVRETAEAGALYLGVRHILNIDCDGGYPPQI